jgi:hypothetical protein
MKTVEELREYSVEHLRYEIWMMQETAQRLLHSLPLHDDAVLKNAAVESCVVHARSLTKFIFPGGDARSDDITSDDYVADQKAWAAARGEIPGILRTANTRTNKEVAHLTTQRRSDGDPRKSWPLVEIIEALHVLLKRFVDRTAGDRLDPSVARFISRLRPPMETPTTTIYNPGSTGLETKLKFPTDVSTTAPVLPWPRSSA